MLGSAALFSKEELTMDTADYEVDEAAAGDYSVASPRIKALQAEEVLVGLRDALSEARDQPLEVVD